MADPEGDLAQQLRAAQARIARLEQEALTNREFLARAIAPGPQKVGGGLNAWHAVTLGVGVAAGVVLALGILVARGPPQQLEPTAAAAKRPPVPVMVVRPVDAGARPAPAPAQAAPVRDAGAVAAPVASADAGAAAGPLAPVKPVPMDDSGALNLLASAEAAVYVDGRKVGVTPLRGHSVRPGLHIVRFVCQVDGGGGSTSPGQAIDVPPFAELDVEYQCDE